jgi:hypothetical protein
LSEVVWSPEGETVPSVQERETVTSPPSSGSQILVKVNSSELRVLVIEQPPVSREAEQVPGGSPEAE